MFAFGRKILAVVMMHINRFAPMVGIFIGTTCHIVLVATYLRREHQVLQLGNVAGHPLVVTGHGTR